MTMTARFNVLRDFVRGEAEWEALRTVGARIELDADSLQLEEPPEAPVYEATAADVAVGLLANWAIGTTLRDWARVLLATGMVGLSSLEDDARGDALLNALWDAAGDADLSDDALESARALAAETQ